MKDLRNNETKLKAQEFQVASLKNNFAITEASEKSYKKKKKKYLTEKQDMKNDSESTSGKRVNMTNSNPR